MPIFRYFLVMSFALFGLLWLADTQLSPSPGPLPNSTAFKGLRLAHVQPKPESLAAVPVPAPDMASAAVLAAEPAAVLAAEPATVPEAKVVATPNEPPSPKSVAKVVPSKKHKRVARTRTWRQHYADASPWSWRSSRPTRYW